MARFRFLFPIAVVLAGCTPPGSPELYKAAEAGNLQQVRKLVQAGHAVDDTHLIVASTFGHPEVMDYLISNGANPDPEDPLEITPLELAVLFGNPHAVRLLIEKGARTDRKGLMAHAAESSGMGRLMQIGKKLREGENPELASHKLARRDLQQVVQLLLEAGADIKSRNDRGQTALMIVA